MPQAHQWCLLQNCTPWLAGRYGPVGGGGGRGGAKKQQIDTHMQYDLPTCICVHICYTVKVLGIYSD